MKQIDYSMIRTLDELRRVRMELDIRSVQIKKSVKTSWDGLKNSLSFTNLVTSMLSNVSVLFAEAEYFRKGYAWVRNWLDEKACLSDAEVGETDSHSMAD